MLSSCHWRSSTWTVLSNQRLAEFQSLPPPWIIWRARLVSMLTPSSSLLFPLLARSMQTIMLDDSIACNERTLIKSVATRPSPPSSSSPSEYKKKEGRESYIHHSLLRPAAHNSFAYSIVAIKRLWVLTTKRKKGKRGTAPWSNWWRHWAQRRLLAVVRRPNGGKCWPTQPSEALCSFDSIMATRLRAISSNDKRRPLWRTSKDQNYRPRKIIKSPINRQCHRAQGRRSQKNLTKIINKRQRHGPSSSSL